MVIETLEALAVLVSLKAFNGSRRDEGGTKVQVMPTWTDNKGNGAAQKNNDHTLPRERPHHGYVSLFQAYADQSTGRVDSEISQSRGRRTGDTRGFDPALEVKIDPEIGQSRGRRVG